MTEQCLNFHPAYACMADETWAPPYR
jgi:hypothetical protein